MHEKESIRTAATQLEVTLSGNDFVADKKKLADKINELVQNDFQKLISILYRLDVNEEKLKHLLRDNTGSDTGIIIADIIIERQIQKIKSRQQFRQRDNDIDENEKW